MSGNWTKYITIIIKNKKTKLRGLDVLRVLVVFGRKIMGVLDRRVFSVLRSFSGQDQRSDGLLHSRLSKNNTIIFWIPL